jgi:RimJ/RimL family protein N-acetyltransferase
VRASDNRPECHLRVLVPDDAEWVVSVDEATATPLARAHGWEIGKLAAELDEGIWASDDRWAWAVIIDGRPAGFVLVEGVSGGDARLSIRLSPAVRGRGAGREVLRQLADHHFSESPQLNRLTGRAHEHNIPMQRAFNAAGFRMEARYRDSFQQTDGRYAAEWGYALTRSDWEAGRHRSAADGYDLHGLVFELDDDAHEETSEPLTFRFLQEGRRAIARYDARHILEGELAGVLVGDLLEYRFVHLEERRDGAVQRTGRGRAQVQRREDGRIELIDTWSADSGAHGRRLLVERRDA